MLQIKFYIENLNFFEVYSSTLEIAVIFVTIVIIVMGIIRLYFLSTSRNSTFSKKVYGNPLVSIHLPICNEPPKLVLKTIESVEKLQYSNFELLIISNNTLDKNLWKPIEEKIADLDHRFKFLHKDKIKGFKAGALNYGLGYTNSSANYIFTLDADYVLNKDAIDVAIGTIQKMEVDLLQFPQSYRNISPETNGVEINYKHYFDCYLSSKKSAILALPTGTLTLIDTKVFNNGYLWPTDSITEDASLGVDLVSRKMKIAFCNYIIGKGTMPTESKDYSKQFKRWVFGNFQVLAKVWKVNGISIMNKIHLSTLLTAWLNLLGFVFLILFLAIPLLIIGTHTGETIFYTGLSAIALHCLFQFFIFNKIAGYNLKKGWNGFLIHLGLLEIGSFYWMNYFVSKNKPFIRTNKFIAPVSSTNKLYIFPLIVFALGIICFLNQYNILGVVICAFSIQLIYAKFHKDQEIIWSKFNLYKKSKK
ncbi:glycosyltransferase family 2 protein [Mesonia ostreae]|uniref:Glycosyltransferase family 2 protein n=1 Tax=Mesonia ostreae TaxID=861110 RepID=A0ABU2KE99_9FLAO|nr:glycosyltransferase family 2 protein [Mesonia ostreae]MDT0293031.1 glycosyltransferase family 2 protein [Mesonia ostreae]